MMGVHIILLVTTFMYVVRSNQLCHNIVEDSLANGLLNCSSTRSIGSTCSTCRSGNNNCGGNCGNNCGSSGSVSRGSSGSRGCSCR